MPVCTTCGTVKSADEFYKRKDRVKGHTSSCKDCRREKGRLDWTPRKQSAYKLKTNYGLSVDEYKSMLEEQNSVCAICKKPETAKSNTGYVKNLAVDHCHKTGKIRGLLCQDCNIGIGKLNDDINLVQSALDYLKEGL